MLMNKPKKIKSLNDRGFVIHESDVAKLGQEDFNNFYKIKNKINVNRIKNDEVITDKEFESYAIILLNTEEQ